MHNLVRILCCSITWVIHIHVAKMVRRIRIWLLCRTLLISNVSLNGRMDGGAWGSVYSISFCTKKCKMLPMFAQPHSPAATLFATVIIWPENFKFMFFQFLFDADIDTIPLLRIYILIAIQTWIRGCLNDFFYFSHSFFHLISKILIARTFHWLLFGMSFWKVA